MSDIEKRLKELYSQKQKIEDEIAALLKKQNKKFSKSDKLRIFRELFVGRVDIYAKEWINSDRTKRYFYPVTATFKGSDYLPLTNEALESHLRGEVILATYPLLKTNKSKYLVFNCSKEYLKNIFDVCDILNISYSCEKNIYDDFHIWIFFQELVDAKTISELKNIIFSKLKKNLKTYPNKEFVTNSDFGLPLELPLQLKSREDNKTIFYDIKSNKPIDDIWHYLSNVKKMSLNSVIELVKKYQVNELKVDNEYNFSEEIKINLSDKIYIEHKYLSKESIEYFKSISSFQNPQVETLLRLKKPLYNIQRVIKDFEEDERHIILPRGLIVVVKEFLGKNSAKYSINDTRFIKSEKFPKISFTLRSEQIKAINAIQKFDYSICVAPPGFGKTLIGAKMIEIREVSTLVIVNKNMLLEQWIDRFVSYFGMNKDEIGFLGKSKNKLNGVLDIATMQSLKNSMDIIKNYSFVIVDECHHIPAFTFEKIIKSFCGKYVLGLSATPKRKDGLEPILYHQLGSVSYESIKKRSHTNIVEVFKTDFESNANNFSDLINDICTNDLRNRLIVDSVIKNIDRKILILTDRVEHVSTLHDLLKLNDIDALMIYGGLKKQEQDEAMEKANDANLIIATTSFFGEGIDFAHLNTVIFATPISFYGRLIQYLGRIGRGGEDCLAIDFLDAKNPMLLSSFSKRKEGYKKMHYSFNYLN